MAWSRRFITLGSWQWQKFGFRKIGFSDLHNILQYNFWIGLDCKNFDHFICKKLRVTIWGRLPWSRHASSLLTTIICQYVLPCWPLSEKQSLRFISVIVWNNCSLKCSIIRPDSQKRKYPPIFDHHWSKKTLLYRTCKQIRFVHQRLRDFVKITLARVSSYWLWLESSLVSKHEYQNISLLVFDVFRLLITTRQYCKAFAYCV